MTKERTKELLPIIQAFAEGKAIQFQAMGYWYDTEDIFAVGNFRIKPLSKLRPWTVEEVPHNNLFRLKINNTSYKIHALTERGLTFQGECWFDFGQLLNWYEHSPDGKKWFPCGVED